MKYEGHIAYRLDGVPHPHREGVVTLLYSLHSLTMPDPSTILPILQFVGVDAIAVCEKIDKAIRLRHEERHLPIGLYEDLCKEVDGLNTDTLDYKALLNSMENDTDLGGRSPYTRFIQRYVMRL